MEDLKEEDKLDLRMADVEVDTDYGKETLTAVVVEGAFAIHAPIIDPSWHVVELVPQLVLTHIGTGRSFLYFAHDFQYVARFAKRLMTKYLLTGGETMAQLAKRRTLRQEVARYTAMETISQTPIFEEEAIDRVKFSDREIRVAKSRLRVQRMFV